MSGDNIHVSIRARPLIEREEREKQKIQWAIENSSIYQKDEKDHKVGEAYNFDKIFEPTTHNKEIYDTSVADLIRSAMNGFHSTIFVYGQTSSGKTYTMLGSLEEEGIMQMAVEDIFGFIQQCNDRRFLLRVSYVEIYNESVNDLLDKSSKDIKVKEIQGQVTYSAIEEIITTPEQFFDVINTGQTNRKIGETHMNARSSRSHTICRIVIESTSLKEGADDANLPVQVSHLNLIDLAGSERISQTGATGQRLKEGTYINKSLSVLCLVINQLVAGQEFISFRDSKLTRILSNSLGGNAKTLIICTITLVSVEDTISTLQFAQRAKAVKNKPEVNTVVSEMPLIKKYAQKTAEFKKLLEAELVKNKNLENEKEQNTKMIMDLTDRIQTLEKLFVKIEPPQTRPVVKRRHTIGWSASAAPSRTERLKTIKENEELVEEILRPSRPTTPETANIAFDVTPKKPIIVSQNGTPEPSLRLRINSLLEDYNELLQFTRIEKSLVLKTETELKAKIDSLTQDYENMSILYIDKRDQVESLQENLTLQKQFYDAQISELKENLNQMAVKLRIAERNKIDKEQIKNDYDALLNITREKFEERERDLIDQINQMRESQEKPVEVSLEICDETVKVKAENQVMALQLQRLQEERETYLKQNEQLKATLDSKNVQLEKLTTDIDAAQDNILSLNENLDKEEALKLKALDDLAFERALRKNLESELKDFKSGAFIRIPEEAKLRKFKSVPSLEVSGEASRTKSEDYVTDNLQTLHQILQDQMSETGSEDDQQAILLRKDEEIRTLRAKVEQLEKSTKEKRLNPKSIKEPTVSKMFNIVRTEREAVKAYQDILAQLPGPDEYGKLREDSFFNGEYINDLETQLFNKSKEEELLRKQTTMQATILKDYQDDVDRMILTECISKIQHEIIKDDIIQKTSAFENLEKDFVDDRNEVLELQSELELEQKTTEELRVKVKRLDEKTERQDDMIVEFKSRNRKLSNKLSRVKLDEKELEQLRQSAGEIESALSSATAELSAHQDKISCLENSLEQLAKEKAELEKENCTMKKEISNCVNQFYSVETALDKFKNSNWLDMLKCVDDELNTIKKHNDELFQLVTTNRAQMGQMKSEIDCMRAKMTTDSEQFVKNETKLKKDLQSKCDHLELTQRQCVDVEKRLKESEDKFSTLKDYSDSLEHKLAQAENELALTKLQLEHAGSVQERALEEENKHLLEENLTMQAQMNDQNEKYEELEGSHKALHDSFDELNSEHIKILAKHQFYMEECKRLEEEVVYDKSQISDLENIEAILKADLRRERDKLELIKEEFEETDKSYRQEINDYKEELTKAQKIAEELQRAKEDIEKKVEALQTEVEPMKTQISELTKQNDLLESHNRALDEKLMANIGKLSLKDSEHKRNILDLEKQIEDLKALEKNREIEIVFLNDELKAKHVHEHTIKAEYDSQKTLLEAELSAEKLTVKDLNVKVKVLTGVIEQLNADKPQVARDREELKKLIAENCLLLEEVATLKEIVARRSSSRSSSESSRHKEEEQRKDDPTVEPKKLLHRWKKERSKEYDSRRSIDIDTAVVTAECHRCQDLQKEIKEQAREIASLQLKISQLMDDNEFLEDEVQGFIDVVRELKSKVKEKDCANCSQLQNNVTQLSDERMILTFSINEKTAMLEKLDQDMKKLAIHLKTVMDENANLKTNLNTEVNEKAKLILKAKELQLKVLETSDLADKPCDECKRLRNEKTALEETLINKHHQIVDLQTKLYEAEDGTKASESESEFVKFYTEKVEMLEKQNNKLKNRLKKHSADVPESVDRESQTEFQLPSLDKYNQLKRICRIRNEEISKLKTEIEILKMRLSKTLKSPESFA